DGKKLGELSGHVGGVFALAAHPRLAQVATAGHDGSVRLYDLNTFQLLHTFIPVPLLTKSQP
ncbi:MAG TPA: hypothetical protein PKD72_08860, partial [Gemmatales bacterium]|nr:hypothetical protein [Gemmatales bacterium]